MNLQRLKVGEFLSIEDLKTYIGYSGTVRDAEIKAILNSATSTVEDRFNISLREMDIIAVCDVSEVGNIKLYYPIVDSVVSVVNSDGDNLQFTFVSGDYVTIEGKGRLTINYTTKAVDNAEMYTAKVLGLAALIFNGIDDNKQVENILKYY